MSVLVLSASVLLCALPALRDEEAIVNVLGLAIVALGLVFYVGFVLVQRGTGHVRVDHPRSALAFLERRLRAELRIAQLSRWAFIGMGLVGAIGTQLLYVDHESPTSVRLWTLSCFLVGVSLIATVPWWVARTVRRQQSKIEEWRRWMDEQSL